MINISKYVSLSEIPADWIFSYYLNTGPLYGQTYRMHSVFNPKDTVPSLFIYYCKKTNQYRYRDFSAGFGGSAIDFFMRHWNMSYQEVAKKITDDYMNNQNNIEKSSKKKIVAQGWKVTSYTKEEWNEENHRYWKEFFIPVKLLQEYKVYPLRSYTMSYVADKEILEQFRIENENSYGFFFANNRLAKIYNPDKKVGKFLKIKNYIQGYEQLKDKSTCYIMSSLKDILAMKVINVDGDYLAADSETSELPLHIIKSLKLKYQNVYVIFDYDVVGLRKMQDYEEKYGFRKIVLPFEKDVSDTLKKHGVEQTEKMVKEELCKIGSTY